MKNVIYEIQIDKPSFNVEKLKDGIVEMTEFTNLTPDNFVYVPMYEANCDMFSTIIKCINRFPEKTCALFPVNYNTGRVGLLMA